MKIYQLDDEGMQDIKCRESKNCEPESKAYRDQAGIWTIGYGFTHYPDGTRIKEGDSMSEAYADSVFHWIIAPYVKGVAHLVTSEINQRQFNSLVSFAYNEGINSLAKSTLLKKVNADPSDPSIKNEFLKWVYVRDSRGGYNTNNGLHNRRLDEAKKYFS